MRIMELNILFFYKISFIIFINLFKLNNFTHLLFGNLTKNYSHEKYNF